MTKINDPRVSVLEKLQNEPRTQEELSRTIPQSSPKLRQALGFLRRQDLIEMEHEPGL